MYSLRKFKKWSTLYFYYQAAWNATFIDVPFFFLLLPCTFNNDISLIIYTILIHPWNKHKSPCCNENALSIWSCSTICHWRFFSGRPFICSRVISWCEIGFILCWTTVLGGDSCLGGGSRFFLVAVSVSPISHFATILGEIFAGQTVKEAVSGAVFREFALYVVQAAGIGIWLSF